MKKIFYIKIPNQGRKSHTQCFKKQKKFTVKKFRSRELQKVAGMRFTKVTGATNVDAFGIRFFLNETVNVQWETIEKGETIRRK